MLEDIFGLGGINLAADRLGRQVIRECVHVGRLNAHNETCHARREIQSPFVHWIVRAG